MNFLAFDTSSPVMSVAIQCGSNPISEKVHSGAWGHMEKLLPFADELLRQQSICLSDIDAFLINQGPGSFTGLRVGYSTLLGLIAENQKPCFGAMSHDLLAERIPCEKHSFLAVCLDAFRSQFYVKVFKNQNNRWVSNQKPQAIHINEIHQMLTDNTLISGNALSRHKSIFDKIHLKLSFAPEELWSPRAASLIRLHQNQSTAVKKLVSSEDFLPIYLRLSEPEERKAELK